MLQNYMKKKKNKTINYEALKYLKSLLHPDIKILDLVVEGKWLKATLPNCYFSVKNQTVD